MTFASMTRPQWITFDCYGTLIRWDEGLTAAMARILARHGRPDTEAGAFIEPYDEREFALEQALPFQAFRIIAGNALRVAMSTLGLRCDDDDVDLLIDAIPKMSPFAEVPDALVRIKAAGFRTCIISNTDDDLIAGNVAQMPADTIDRTVTAQQAGAYKPDPRLFEHAWSTIGAKREDIVHVCASPRLDHTAARDLGFRCIWIDRGTGRALLPDYHPDATVRTLDAAIRLFDEIGWMGS